MINISNLTYLILNNSTLQYEFGTFVAKQNQQENQIVEEEWKGESNVFALIYILIEYLKGKPLRAFYRDTINDE